jgi:hypothetical protein
MAATDERRRDGWRQRIRARPLLWAALPISAIAALTVVLVWFQPQALLFDTVVEEAFPTAQLDGPPTEPGNEGRDDRGEVETRSEDATPDVGAPLSTPDPAGVEPQHIGSDGHTDPPDATGPTRLASGTFDSRNRYTVEGEATVYELDDGSRTLRLEGFSSTNGPDLFVYLAAAGSADSAAALDEDHVNLGVLKGNVGNQNYTIADGIDLDRYDTVVIWCRRFTVGFGAADLTPIGGRL